MKKKISVFALLLSLMLSFIVPVRASAATETTADDVKYADIQDFMDSAGYTDFTCIDNAVYFVFSYQDRYYVYEICSADVSTLYACTGNFGDYVKMIVTGSQGVENPNYYVYYAPAVASSYDNYGKLSSSKHPYYNRRSFNGVNVYCIYNYLSNNNPSPWFDLQYLIYSDLNVYANSSTSTDIVTESDVILFESTKYTAYNFPSWCSDAGLNCLASSNESPLKIPYSYNEYWHIVRKTSSGKWLLTTIGNSVMQENIDDYRLFVGENGNLHVASIYGSDDVKGYELNVRQYEYDTDGWKVRTFETFDIRDYSGIVDLGSGSGFDNTRVLAYTGVDIYNSNGTAPLYEKSEEYFEVTFVPDTPVEPDEPDTPTPIPTTAPGSGSGSGRPGSGTRPNTGGQATGGGGLDFIINLFTMIWTKICSVPMYVDGYSISLQQIVIYGALVSIVGGFIMHFIFGRK